MDDSIHSSVATCGVPSAPAPYQPPINTAALTTGGGVGTITTGGDSFVPLCCCWWKSKRFVVVEEEKEEKEEEGNDDVKKVKEVVCHALSAGHVARGNDLCRSSRRCRSCR